MATRKYHVDFSYLEERLTGMSESFTNSLGRIEHAIDEGFNRVHERQDITNGKVLNTKEFLDVHRLAIESIPKIQEQQEKQNNMIWKGLVIIGTIVIVVNAFWTIFGQTLLKKVFNL